MGVFISAVVPPQEYSGFKSAVWVPFVQSIHVIPIPVYAHFGTLDSFHSPKTCILGDAR